MVVRGSTVLITYSDSNQRDYPVANRLTSDLRNNDIHANLRGYSGDFQDIDSYQWLIVIYSPEIAKSPVNKIVNDTLDQVVKRRKRGIIAVTASAAELPNEWATIRKYDYDINNRREANAAVEGILRSMGYAKLPYAEAQVLEQQQRRAEPVNKRRPLVVVAGLIGVAVCVAALAVFLSIRPPLHSSTGNTHTATATAQAKARTTETALANTPQATPTPDIQALQQEYQTITAQKPTIAGFEPTEQWHVSQDQVSCAFDASNPADYHARITTPQQYVPCSAKNTSFTNFAMQVTMNILGDAGGVFFRSQHGTYYRVAFNQIDLSNDGTDMLSLYLCQKDCTTEQVDDGTQLWSMPVTVDSKQPLILTVIAQSNTIDLFYNGTPEAHVIDTTSPQVFSGAIGVYAASLGNPTDVTFSNLMVWSLDKQK
ncbi:MAG TPA: hypothetical protein VJ761_05560 [Ktedonobacteraceae bacterium]|nr:hypothetical protein [Ktedonobacteraceae bacterium]